VIFPKCSECLDFDAQKTTWKVYHNVEVVVLNEL